MGKYVEFSREKIKGIVGKERRSFCGDDGGMAKVEKELKSWEWIGFDKILRVSCYLLGGEDMSGENLVCLNIDRGSRGEDGVMGKGNNEGKVFVFLRFGA